MQLAYANDKATLLKGYDRDGRSRLAAAHAVVEGPRSRRQARLLGRPSLRRREGSAGFVLRVGPAVRSRDHAYPQLNKTRIGFGRREIE
jgi:hypothetical protein